MPDRLELSQFEPRTGEAFAVQGADGVSLDLTLEEANRAKWQPEDDADFAFELIFRGPQQPVLPQATYRMTNSALGDLDLFIVPLKSDAGGTTYQAVFS